MSLRPLPLPDDVPGKIWLTAMPGRFEPLASFVDAAEAVGATGIICLTSDDEIAQRSPAYATARRLGTMPFDRRDHPILDYGLPQDRENFARFITDLCADLAGGQRLILHCAAGIGRTGVVAQQVLMAFGVEPDQATAQVLQAGSGGESAAQKEFCNQPVLRFSAT
jgi:atypical dual specificity phosphatase